jgi:hypothetical protein
MLSSKATVTQLAFLVSEGEVFKATEYLFNDVAKDERRSVFYGSIASLIQSHVSPRLISVFRDTVRGCAYDCGLDDPNIQSHWTDEDHINTTNAIGDYDEDFTRKSHDGIVLNCRRDSHANDTFSGNTEGMDRLVARAQ